MPPFLKGLHVDADAALHMPMPVSTARVPQEVAAGAKHSLLCDNPQSRSVGLCSGACDDAFFPESDGTAAAEVHGCTPAHTSSKRSPSMISLDLNCPHGISRLQMTNYGTVAFILPCWTRCVLNLELAQTIE
eukprot:2399501-Pleurochrysis_carterae.AAC.1